MGNPVYEITKGNIEFKGEDVTEDPVDVRAKKGMFLGDLKDGELEVGQISASMDTIKPASDIVKEIIEEFEIAKNKISKIML